jgi:hypothetical protein
MSKFGSAFNAALKSGKKEFTFNGKSYSTKVAADTPQSDPIPTAAVRQTASVPPSKPASPASSIASKSQSANAGGGNEFTNMVTQMGGPSEADRSGVIASEKAYTNDDMISAAKRNVAQAQKGDGQPAPRYPVPDITKFKTINTALASGTYRAKRGK